MCNLNYLEILDFLHDKKGNLYHKPDYPGLKNEERNEYLNLAERGSIATNSMFNLCQYFSRHIEFEFEYEKVWQNSGHIANYFWGRLRHKQHLDSPICIAIFARPSNRFEIRLEIEEEKCVDHTTEPIQLQKYYRYLELPVEINTGLVFIQASEHNDHQDNDAFIVDTRSQTEIQSEKLHNQGTVNNRIWLSYYIERDRCCDEEFIHGIELIQRYYNHIFGI